MQDWLQAQMDNGFAAFTGAVVTASIPVRDALLNELIAAYLIRARDDATAGRAGATAPPAVDPLRFLPLVRAVSVQTAAGALTLHLELAVTDRS